MSDSERWRIYAGPPGGRSWRKTHHHVLRVEVVAVGAVVEVDLVVGLRGQANHGAMVVPAVAAPTNHPLAHGRPLGSLEDGGLSGVGG